MQKDSHQTQANHLYEENQKMGYHANYLADQNNFYRISINNIKKLNSNIHKHLLATNSQFFNAKKRLMDAQNITESYKILNNKVQLKNIQMKVGNCKRQTEKVKKVYDGSVLALNTKAEELQLQINVLTRQLKYYAIEAKLLENISMADYEDQKQAAAQPLSVRSHIISSANIIASLEEASIQSSTKIENLGKQERSIKKQKSMLLEQISKLSAQQSKMRDTVACFKSTDNYTNLREAHSKETQKLLKLNKEQADLLEEIRKQDELLEEQYRINQEYRQRIIDCNQQESKNIKVLQEEIVKCGEQVRQVRQKYEQLYQAKGARAKHK